MELLNLHNLDNLGHKLVEKKVKIKKLMMKDGQINYLGLMPDSQ